MPRDSQQGGKMMWPQHVELSFIGNIRIDVVRLLLNGLLIGFFHYYELSTAQACQPIPKQRPATGTNWHGDKSVGELKVAKC
jgi:hypothetical protein